MPKFFFSSVVCLVASFSLAACLHEAIERSEKPIYGLASNLSFASVRQESPILDLGSDEKFFKRVRGWSARQEDKKRRTTFRWGLGSESSFEMFIIKPRALSLTLVGRPFSPSNDDHQTVTTLFNGTAVGIFTMKPGLHEYQVEIPIEEVRQGDNKVVFQYKYAHRPSDVTKTTDTRELAVAWYRVSLSNTISPDLESPRVANEEDLVLPYGTQIDFYLKPPTAARLVVRDLRFIGANPGNLSIHLQSEGESEVDIGSRSETGSFAVDLTVVGQPVKVSIRAIAKQPWDGAGGVSLSKPMIWAPPEDGSEPPPRLGPVGTSNVVFYVIDTLRADHLRCYGYDSPTSPAIDSLLADGGILFENALAQSSWTKPAVASLLTGLWPLEHGAVGGGDRLPVSALTLGEILQDKGYVTAAFAANPNIRPTFGFEQGFDRLESLRTEASSREINELAFEWLDDRPPTRPFFLYLHSMDVHPPYLAPAEPGKNSQVASGDGISDEVQALIGRLHKYGDEPLTSDQQRQIVSLYDNQIAFNDKSFEELLGFLRQKGLYDKSVIVLVADHGEEFFDHGVWGHRKNLRSATVRIPLIIRLPNSSAPLRLRHPVQQVDIAPTVLDYLGLPLTTAVFEGRSLLPLIGSTSPSIEDWASSPVFQHLRTSKQTQVAIVQDGWKLLVSFRKGMIQEKLLYSVVTDRGETAEVSTEHPITTEYLYALVKQWIDRAQTPPSQSREAVIDEELQDSLRSLGYLE